MNTRRGPGGYHPPWTEEDDQYLRDNYDKQSARQIALAVGRTEAAVHLRASRNGLKSLHRTGINSLVKGYFNTIDTPVKAYLLGLLAADGFITKANQLCLVLRDYDQSAVELFRDEIAPGVRLGSYLTKEGNKMVGARVASPHLAADLARHGIVPAKTLLTFWPPNLPTRLEGSYICGYFDGDGSLHAEWIYRWTVVGGNESFLAAMQDRIEAGCDVRPGGPYRDKRHKHAWSIVATGKPVQAIDAWIHQDVPGLARKRLS